MNPVRHRLYRLMHLQLLALLLVSTASFMGCTSSKPSMVADKVQNIIVAEPSGQVQLLKTADSQWLDALSGMVLSKSDTLATGLKANVALDVDLDKHILVGEEVRLTVLDLLFEAGKNTKVQLDVENGSLYFRINRKLDTDDSFEIKTPNCIMGVRGTHFVVEVDGAQTLISVLDGQVTGKTQNEAGIASVVEFSIDGGYKLLIPETVSSEKDLIRTPLLQSDLPVFVLTEIKKNPDSLPKDYTDNIDEALEIRQDQEISPADMKSQRLMDPFTGHRYQLYDADGDFQADEAFCESLGGHLMTITSEGEQQIAERLLASGEKAFYLIGLYQAEESVEPQGGFQWITGESLTYTHWHQENGVETEPNDSGIGGKPENFTTLSRAGTWPLGDWNDQNLENLAGNYGFLCEWDGRPDPSTSIPDATKKPFDPSLLTYENFIALQLGGSADETVAFFGEGTHISNPDDERWLWGNQDKFITINVKSGKISGYTQKGLQETVVDVDLKNIAMRGKLLECASLAEVEDLLGVRGTLMSHFVMDGEQIISAYVWHDKSGQKVMVTVNETTQGLDISF